MREGAHELLLGATESPDLLSRLASTPAWLSSAMTVCASRSMSAAMIVRGRSSIWNTISIVLERKPGALRGSKPLAQWRAQGRWPESYDRLWELMAGKHGRQGGARAMVAVIRMGREFGHAKLEATLSKRSRWVARMWPRSAICS